MSVPPPKSTSIVAGLIFTSRHVILTRRSACFCKSASESVCNGKPFAEGTGEVLEMRPHAVGVRRFQGTRVDLQVLVTKELQSDRIPRRGLFRRLAIKLKK